MLPAHLHMRIVLQVSFVLQTSRFASMALARNPVPALLPPDSEDYFKMILRPVLLTRSHVPSVENVSIPGSNAPPE